MDKAQALHAFWSSFGWIAIDEHSAYDEGLMEDLGDPDRYITYEGQIGEIDAPVALTASLWHRSASWADVSEKAAEIEAALKNGGVKQDYEGGQIWITRGAPFIQRGPIESDFDMRRITIQINAEFLSA